MSQALITVMLTEAEIETVYAALDYEYDFSSYQDRVSRPLIESLRQKFSIERNPAEEGCRRSELVHMPLHEFFEDPNQDVGRSQRSRLDLSHLPVDNGISEEAAKRLDSIVPPQPDAVDVSEPLEDDPPAVIARMNLTTGEDAVATVVTAIEPPKDDFATWLREFRNRHTMSQREMGNIVGFEQTRVSQVERGARRLTPEEESEWRSKIETWNEQNQAKPEAAKLVVSPVEEPDKCIYDAILEKKVPYKSRSKEKPAPDLSAERLELPFTFTFDQCVRCVSLLAQYPDNYSFVGKEAKVPARAIKLLARQSWFSDLVSQVKAALPDDQLLARAMVQAQHSIARRPQGLATVSEEEAANS